MKPRAAARAARIVAELMRRSVQELVRDAQRSVETPEEAADVLESLTELAGELAARATPQPSGRPHTERCSECGCVLTITDATVAVLVRSHEVMAAISCLGGDHVVEYVAEVDGKPIRIGLKITPTGTEVLPPPA